MMKTHLNDLGGKNQKYLNELQSHQLEAFFLKALHNFSHQPSMHTIRFYSDKGALVHSCPAYNG